MAKQKVESRESRVESPEENALGFVAVSPLYTNDKGLVIGICKSEHEGKTRYCARRREGELFHDVGGRPQAKLEKAIQILQILAATNNWVDYVDLSPDSSPLPQERGPEAAAEVEGAVETPGDERPHPSPLPQERGPDAAPDAPEGVSVQSVRDSDEAYAVLDIGLVHASAKNPRESFDDDTLEELKESIRGNGQIQPIVVRPDGNGGYEIIVGERRWRALIALESATIKAVIRTNLGDVDAAFMRLGENLNRDGMNPMEESDALGELYDSGIPVTEIAMRLYGGEKRQPMVSKKISLRRLPAEAQEAVRKRQVKPSIAGELLKYLEWPGILAYKLSRALSGATQIEIASLQYDRRLEELGEIAFIRGLTEEQLAECRACKRPTGANVMLCFKTGCLAEKQEKANESRESRVESREPGREGETHWTDLSFEVQQELGCHECALKSTTECRRCVKATIARLAVRVETAKKADSSASVGMTDPIASAEVQSERPHPSPLPQERGPEASALELGLEEAPAAVEVSYTIEQIVADWLETHGYDGFYESGGECGCCVGDLFPCGREARASCRAGYKGPCDCGDHDWHIYGTKALAEAAKMAMGPDADADGLSLFERIDEGDYVVDTRHIEDGAWRVIRKYPDGSVTLEASNGERLVMGRSMLDQHCRVAARCEVEAYEAAVAPSPQPSPPGDGATSAAPAMHEVIRVGDSIVPRSCVQEKKELVGAFEKRLRAAVRMVINVDGPCGVLELNGHEEMHFDTLDEDWRWYMTPEMVNVGDVIATEDDAPSQFKVRKKGKNEVRLVVIGAADGAADSHPGWNTFARCPHVFIERMPEAEQ